MPYEAHVVASNGTDEGSAAPPRPAIQAVPLKGLPIVAAIMVFPLAAIARNWQWALDLFHVGGGGLWTAIDLLVGLVVGPILGRLRCPVRRRRSAVNWP
jgi:hypothetical protein